MGLKKNTICKMSVTVNGIFLFSYLWDTGRDSTDMSAAWLCSRRCTSSFLFNYRAVCKNNLFSVVVHGQRYQHWREWIVLCGDIVWYVVLLCEVYFATEDYVRPFNVFILLNGWICFYSVLVWLSRLSVGFRTHLKSMQFIIHVSTIA